MSPPDQSGIAGAPGQVEAGQVEAGQVEAYGVGGPAGREPTVIAKLRNRVIDLNWLQSAGLLNVVSDQNSNVFAGRSLNRFLSLGSMAWRAIDERLSEIVSEGIPRDALASLVDTHLVLPVEVADFCDFYASEYHASNMGRILRPGSEPLPPAWRSMPLGYHGRAGTVVVGGTPVRRPKGIFNGPDGPMYRASRRLDLEVELGYVVGEGSNHGNPVPVSGAREHLFGVVVLNDWSARDIQSFEYQPLGPFLGKSFATSISPWVVPMRVLEAFAVDGPEQGEEVGPHLSCPQPRAFDISLELSINSTIVSCPEARYVHWSPEQLVAHLTSNGSSLRTGDLLATGTISGPDRACWGSLMELAWGGDGPITLSDGTKRAWLEDGDTVTIRARLVDRNLANRNRASGEGSTKSRNEEISIPLGEVTGTILAAEPGS